MKAYISGVAGLALVERPSQVRPLGESPRSLRHVADALRIFDGCSDVLMLVGKTTDDIDKAVKIEWAKDRALRLFLFLLDPDEPAEYLIEYAECIEQLIDDYQLIEYMERQMFAAPLPDMVDLAKVETACANFDVVATLFSRLVLLRQEIEKTRSCFDNAAEQMEAEPDRMALRKSLADSGIFREIVLALEANVDIAFLKLQTTSRFRLHNKIILQWFAALQPELPRISSAQLAAQAQKDGLEPADEWGDLDGFAPPSSEAASPNYQVKMQIESQQAAIVAKLKEFDPDRAKRLLDDLIKFQSSHSTPIQIGQTLCSMSQAAKRHEMLDLQLEWAEEATKVSPKDPITFGHLADALIGIGRYDEAEVALNASESAGDPLYAANGRARILRDIGKLNEARAAFVEAAKQFNGIKGVEYCWIGAADTLRQMGDTEHAIEEFQKLAENFPLEPAVWSSLAFALMDAGRVTDATITFTKAAKHGKSIPFKIARASTYRLVGAFDEALQLYAEILKEFPNNHLALCGQAHVLNLRGDSSAALAIYDEAIRRSPYSSAAYVGKGNLLRSLGRIREAADLFQMASEKFGFDSEVALGSVAVLQAEGKYEDALSAVDEISRRFPFARRAQIYRASILHRLGQSLAALAILDGILQDRPNDTRALIAKLGIYIKLERYYEAQRLLPQSQYRTRFEWRRHLLQAFLFERKGNMDKAVKHLEWGIRHCRFWPEKCAMLNAVARIELARSNFSRALEVTNQAPTEISNVIMLDVLATNNQSEAAQKRLQNILEEPNPPIVIELAKEIARRHRLVSGPPQHSRHWINFVQQDISLLAAA